MNCFVPTPNLGGCDWYAAEYDPKARVFFGYEILMDDFQNSEWGYFSFDELREIRAHGSHVDRGLHWRARPASEVERILQGMRQMWCKLAIVPSRNVYIVIIGT